MKLDEFLSYMDTGKEIAAGSPVHQCMHSLAQEAIKLTSELNSRYHTSKEIVELMQKITGRQVDDSFSLFPPILYRLRKKLKNR